MNRSDEANTEAAAIAELATRAAEPRVIDTGDGSALLLSVPAGVTVEDRSHLMPAPARIKEKRVVVDPVSFQGYVSRFSNMDSLLQACETSGQLNCVLDSHGKDSPRWGDHVVSMVLVETPRYRRWSQCLSRGISQRELQELLMDCHGDVIEPDGLAILQMADNFRVVREVKYSSASRLADGTFQLQYSEDTKNGTVKLPERLRVRIPRFVDADLYPCNAVELDLELRYRLREGEVTFTLRPSLESAEVLRQSFRGIVHALAEELGLLLVWSK